ncbi:alpha/beta-Hydrolases superfamily protein [Zostera marina]|uniref:GPI inositol-deacylase n=1 Tax=Zostera marina TaxID=29655 RepID=A0A0K9NP61_ZOSMR|nr:alpha/beta-Hydrolases superfamily protein [Zostera marina]
MGFLLHASLSSPSPSTPKSNTAANNLASPRPVIILPGLGNNSKDYHGLVMTLQSYNIPSVVVKVSRIDWLRNAYGLADPNYWKGTLKPRPILDWYLKRVEDAIIESKQLQQGDQKLSLIGHSAGGWLARVFMEEFNSSDVSLLLTLGSPHLPSPKDTSGVLDQTRGLLDYVEKYCKPAVYSLDLKYICIAGRYIQGSRFDVKSTETGESTLRTWFIGQGYKQVCGRADVWGDGVVPEVSAHLKGALNITYDGIYHSPVGSDDTGRPWYGSPLVVDKWVHHLLC